MSKRARICIGNYTDVIDVKDTKVFGDRITIVAKDGSRTTTHISNIVIWEEPETPAEEGIWLINPDGYYPYCSKCGYEPEIPHIHKDNRTPYCANCGVKMRKECQDDR